MTEFVGVGNPLKPSLDITGIPFVETVGLLRFFGKELVSSLLNPPLASRSLPPSLVDLIRAAPQFETLRNAGTQDRRVISGAGSPGGTTKTTSTKKSDNADDFNVLVSGLLNGTIRIDEFDRLQRTKFLEVLGGIQYSLIPSTFWQLAGISAWFDLKFQYESAYAARRFFLSRTLLPPNDNTEPAFSPAAMWALLAQTRIEQSAAQFSQEPSSEWPITVARTLRSAALHLASPKGVPNSWDRWLLARALNLWVVDNEETRRTLEAAYKDPPDIAELFKKA